VLNGDDAAWSETLVGRLVHLRPVVYDGGEVSTLNGALRAAGVQPGQIHRQVEGKGVTRHGIRASDLDSARPAIDSAAASTVTSE
jgi:hypothetical protein